MPRSTWPRTSGKVCVRVPQPGRAGGSAGCGTWPPAPARSSSWAITWRARASRRSRSSRPSDYWRIWFYLLEAAGLDGAAGQRPRRQERAGPSQDGLVDRTTAAILRSGCVRRGVRPARFAARDQRRGCAAGVVRAGGAAAGSLRRREICSSRIGSLTATARWSCRSRRSSPSWRRAGGRRRRSGRYGMDLLRWFRFLWAVGVGWDQATRVEARDFCRWLQVADKPARPHWRHPGRRCSAIGRGRGPGRG